MKKQLLRMMLVAVAMVFGASGVWAQTTWEFVGNTAVWGAEGVTLNGGAQYDENANVVATGGVTFTGTSGFVATAKGIGFNAVGSTEDENISIVVPAGYKATVSIYTSGNRTVVGSFNGATQTFNANWISSTKEFDNSEGAGDVTLYLYCNQNPGGDQQNKAPFLEKIVLMDMSSAKAYPWTANAVAMIDGVKTTIKTYGSETDIVEGSQYTVIVDKAIKFGDDYYGLNDAQFAENVFGAIFTMGDAAANYEFNYEKIENVAFYGEIEDIYTEGLRANRAPDAHLLSNDCGYFAMGSEGYVKVTFSVPEDGTYDLALGMNNTNDKDRGFNYAIDDNDVSETITVKAGNAYVQYIMGQTLTAGEHTLTLNITYSLTPVFDYLLITQIPTFWYSGLCYRITSAEERTVELILCPKEFSGELVIPEEVEYNGITYTVTSIAGTAFQYCADVTSITVSESVTYIGDGAFAGCSSLSYIYIPSSVSYLGTGCFEGCTSLYSITYSTSGGTEQTIEDGTTEINEEQIIDWVDLTAVTLPATLKSIGEKCFYGCFRLMSVTSKIKDIFPINDNVFSDVTYQYGTLIVPDGMKTVYETTSGWKNFKNIIEESVYTSISTVATAAEQAEVYNMAGQRVMNAQKGLYIVNGKKVVIK